MSLIRNHVRGGEGTAGPPPFYPYKINQSLRFNDDDSAYLSRTPSVAGNRKTWTWSGWVKRCNLGTTQQLFSVNNGGGTFANIGFSSADKLQVQLGTPRRRTNRLFRDPSAWYHIVAICDTTNATGDDRLQLWVNGVRQTDFDEDTDPTLNADHAVNNTIAHGIGAYPTNTNHSDAYMAEVNFVDGQALTVGDFGELKNGVWIPKSYEGTYGTNGFYLDFADSGDIGNDVSGNNNDWTVNNLAATDVVLDSPTNNFCTFNPLDVRENGPATLSQGNLRRDDSSTTGRSTYSTFHITSGKWYWESYAISTNTLNFFARFVTPDNTSWGWRANGTVQSGLSGPSISTYTDNDILGICLDYDSEEVEFYKNGVSQGVYTFATPHDNRPITPCIVDGTSSSSGGDCAINFGQDSTFAGLTTAGGFTDVNGIGDFKYEPPIGALALCSQNLPETTISPSTGYAQKTELPLTYTIDQSLRFNDDDVASLSKLFTSAGDRRTWTWSGWIKRANLERGRLISADDGATSQNNTYIRIEDSGAIKINGEISNSNTPNVETQNVFNDVDKYYHVLVAFDTTQATATDRTKIYVDGQEQILTYTVSQGLNTEHFINDNSNTHHIGGSTQGTQMFDGYLGEVNFIDGQALTPSDFGELKNGQWVPKAFAGTYGSNGYYLDFANDSDIGNDVSGNNNDWTVNNISDYDVVEDNPTTNFCTFASDDIDSGHSSLKQGSLHFTIDSWSDYNATVRGTTQFSSGKYYIENVPKIESGTGNGVGMWFTGALATAASSDYILNITGQTATHGIGFSADPNSSLIKFNSVGMSASLSDSTTIDSYASGDIVSIAIDLDEDKIWVGKNGTWLSSGDPATGSNPTATFSSNLPLKYVGEAISSSNNANRGGLLTNFGQDSTFAGDKTTGSANASDENGVGDFYYTPPAGFLALTESNLPDTTVTPVGIAEDNFNTLLYTGDGTSTRSVTGVGFQPDLVWQKSRAQVFPPIIVDGVRGAGASGMYILQTSATDVEYSSYGAGGSIDSIDSDGITLQGGTSHNNNFNSSGLGYVTWNWKMGGAGVSNTDGTITSTVSANTVAGQSIVDFNMPSTSFSNETVGHGLDKIPEFIITKSTDITTNWTVHHKDLSSEDHILYLNLTGAEANAVGSWGTMSSTNFTLGSESFWGLNRNNVAYCFHSVDGYSKFGSYVGNNSADGPFVYLGFRPRYVMIKRTDGTGPWLIFDTERSAYNVMGENTTLESNSSNAEFNYPYLDGLSNGMKVRAPSGNTAINANGGDYIYAAFAENPFKYSTAR